MEGQLKKPGILCMFSGGLDSTAVLHKLITEEEYREYELIIHHIHMINREQRARAEMMAVKNILNYYVENYKVPFVYTQCVFNTNGFDSLQTSRFPYDVDVCSFVAGNVCTSHGNIKIVTRGRTKTDLESRTDSNEEQHLKTYGIFELVLQLAKLENPEYHYPVIDMTKEEIWNSLPDKVRKMAWWCRRPIYKDENTPLPCNKCKPCLDMAKIDSF
ncbi:hypothetical protein [Reichenbachiella sp.]|uniref:hypothetical protein n=1 Tax=Reichenbachiella sp. TaxID=2184521 RepID=UPI003B5A9A5B